MLCVVRFTGNQPLDCSFSVLYPPRKLGGLLGKRNSWGSGMEYELAPYLRLLKIMDLVQLLL